MFLLQFFNIVTWEYFQIFNVVLALKPQGNTTPASKLKRNLNGKSVVEKFKTLKDLENDMSNKDASKRYCVSPS